MVADLIYIGLINDDRYSRMLSRCGSCQAKIAAVRIDMSRSGKHFTPRQHPNHRDSRRPIRYSVWPPEGSHGPTQRFHSQLATRVRGHPLLPPGTDCVGGADPTWPPSDGGGSPQIALGPKEEDNIRMPPLRPALLTRTAKCTGP